MNHWIESTRLAICILKKGCNGTVILPPTSCESGEMLATFTQVDGPATCFVRYSNSNYIINGPSITEDLISTTICIPSGYYLIGCNGSGVINIKILSYNKDHDLTDITYHMKILRFTSGWLM